MEKTSKPSDKGDMEDPYRYNSQDENDGENFQSWANPQFQTAKIGGFRRDNDLRSSKSESSTSLSSSSKKSSYEPVVVRDDGSKSNPKQYPGAKKEDNFKVRMKLLASRQQRITIDTSTMKSIGKSNKKRLYHTLVAQEVIDSLDCSEEMKNFIKSEFKRERKMYTFLPDNQIVNSIIHRYKTHILNSPKSRSSRTLSRNSKVRRGSSAKLKGRKKTVASVDTDDASDAEISEFEDEVSIPDRGSFSLSPSTSQLKVFKHVLTRFASDQESYSISDSSPEVTKRTIKRTRKNVSQSPSKRLRTDDDSSYSGQELKVSPLAEEGKRPVLSSASLADNMDMFSEEADDSPKQLPPMELAGSIVEGMACGNCHERNPEILFCSKCRVIGYCDEMCQRSNWESHKKMCNKLKKGSESVRLNLIIKELDFENNNQCSAAGDKKKVTIISQPEFAPSNDELFPKEGNNTIAKSILKKGKISVDVVLNSPPIKSLEHHIQLVREGSQEARFDKLLEGSSLDDDEDVSTKLKPTGRSSLIGSLTSPGRPRSSKLSDEKFDEIMQQLEKIHSSPPKKDHEVPEEATNEDVKEAGTSNSSIIRTPSNSPRVARVVEALSSHRTTSRKSHDRTRRATPFPSTEGTDELEITVRRKIDFSTIVEDNVENEEGRSHFEPTEDLDLLSSNSNHAETEDEPDVEELNLRRKINFSAVADDLIDQAEYIEEKDIGVSFKSNPAEIEDEPEVEELNLRRKINFSAVADDLIVDSNSYETSVEQDLATAIDQAEVIEEKDLDVASNSYETSADQDSAAAIDQAEVIEENDQPSQVTGSDHVEVNLDLTSPGIIPESPDSCSLLSSEVATIQVETGNSEFLDDEIVNEGEDVDKVADLFSDLEASQSQTKQETNNDKHEDVDHSEDVDKIADLFSDLEASQSQSKPETDDKHEDDVDHSDEEDMFSEYETSQSQNKLEPSQVLSSSL